MRETGVGLGATDLLLDGRGRDHQRARGRAGREIDVGLGAEEARARGRPATADGVLHAVVGDPFARDERGDAPGPRRGVDDLTGGRRATAVLDLAALVVVPAARLRVDPEL